MLITPQYLIEHGYNVSADKMEAIALAIQTAEHFCFKNAVGPDVYAQLLHAEQGTKAYEARKGNETMSGYETAIGHLTYSILLTENINVTRFGTVKKTSEDSMQADFDDIQRKAYEHAAIYRACAEEASDFLGISFDPKTTLNSEWL